MSQAAIEPRFELADRISSALHQLDALHHELGAARQRLQRLSVDLGGAPPEEIPASPAATASSGAVPKALPSTLTAREFEVLGLLADGHTNAAIAERLMIADGTAKKHVFRVLRKLGVANRSEAVAYWFRAGWFRAGEDGRTSPTL